MDSEKGRQILRLFELRMKIGGTRGAQLGTAQNLSVEYQRLQPYQPTVPKTGFRDW
jgi:hypothetical protein